MQRLKQVKLKITWYICIQHLRSYLRMGSSNISIWMYKFMMHVHMSWIMWMIRWHSLCQAITHRSIERIIAVNAIIEESKGSSQLILLPCSLRSYLVWVMIVQISHAGRHVVLLHIGMSVWPTCRCHAVHRAQTVKSLMLLPWALCSPAVALKRVGNSRWCSSGGAPDQLSTENRC